jgi:hypothetical protein
MLEISIISAIKYDKYAIRMRIRTSKTGVSLNEDTLLRINDDIRPNNIPMLTLETLCIMKFKKSEAKLLKLKS